MSARAPTLGRAALSGRRLAVVAGGLALAVVVVATARIATGFGRTYSYLVPSARHGFPDWMRGPLAGLASPLSRHGFVILLAATSIGFVVALVVAPRLPVWLTAAAITVLVTICALAPPLLSTDVFNYVAYARMGVRGINPYAHGTIAFRGDPSYPYVGHFWNHTPTAYGPPFTLFSYSLAPLGVAAAMWAFKAIAAVATLACVALTWSCARLLGRQPMRAALLVGLNPLVLVFGVGGGHNDALLALVVLAGIWLLLRRRAAAGAAAVSSAAGVKLSAALALPFMAIAERPSRRVMAGILSSGALLIGAGFAVFGSSLLNIGDAVRLEQRYGYQLVSLPGFAAQALGFGPIHSHGGLALKLLFVGVSAALGIRCIRDRNWLAATGWSLLVLLATLGWVMPWYVLWLLPFAALAQSRLLLPATVALTLAITVVWASHYATSHAGHHRHRLLHRAALASLSARTPRISELARRADASGQMLLGRSYDGRPIVAVHVGDPHARRVLVVGCIHGTEAAGIAVTRALEHANARADLWIVPDLNPDGHARHTRQNGRGVDLNANWSSQWHGGGRPWNPYYAGPRPFSERETRIARDLILRLRPRVTIWFHQHMDLVWAWGPSSAAGRVYARAAGMRFYHHHWLPGTAANWQNHHMPGSSAFTVELPAGSLSPQQVRRHVRAVLTLAATAFRTRRFMSS